MQLNPEATARLREDALRGGSAAHPLTLIFLGSLLGNNLPDDDFLRKLTSRSIKSFQAIWEKASGHLSDEELDCLARLTRIGLPLSLAICRDAFGTVVDQLLEKRLLDEVGGNVVVHAIIRRLVQERELS